MRDLFFIDKRERVAIFFLVFFVMLFAAGRMFLEQSIVNDVWDVSLKLNKKVDINTANFEQLKTLPGVGNVTAEKIIAYRKENGLFSDIDQLKKIQGLGDKKTRKLKEYVVF